VLAIDTASGKVLDAIVGGNQTTGLDVSADGRLLAFSDFLDNRIHVFAVPSYRELAAGGGGRAAAHRAELAKR
jgi:sugar lactone lactonase YvrE